MGAVNYKALPAYLLLLLACAGMPAWAQTGIEGTLRFNRAVFTSNAQNSGAILQDRDGFIWVGTFGGGLIRFDGYDKKVFKPGGENPLPDGFVNCLYEDRDGMIWIQTGSSGLMRYDKNTETFTRFAHDKNDPHSLSFDSSTIFAMGTIRESADGLVWIGTQGGLNAFNKRTNSFTRYLHVPSDPKSLAYNDVHAVLVDRKDRIWIGTNGGGLDRLDRETGTFVHYVHDPQNPRSLASNVVYALLEDRDGALWVGTDRGLQKLDPGDGTFAAYALDRGNPSGASRDMVVSLVQDSHGTIWISFLKSELGGIVAFDPKSGSARRYLSRPEDPFSPSTNFIRNVLEDRAGILWMVNLVGSIDKLDPHNSRFVYYAPREMASSFISTLCLDAAGNIWIGTFPVGLTLRDARSGEFRQYFRDFHYSALLEDRSGKLWVGTTRPAALHLLDGKTGRIVKSFSHDPSNPLSMSSGNMQINAIVEDKFDPDLLWIGTYGAGLECFNKKTETFSHYPHDPANTNSVSLNIMLCLLKDSEGILWLPTMGGGLNRLDTRTGRFTRYLHDPKNPASIESNTTLSIFEDSAGRLWIGTAIGFEMFDRSTGEFVHYTQATGYPLTMVHCIAEDDHGDLWMGSFCGDGLARFDPRTKAMKVFREGDGLPSDTYGRAALRDREGKMWFSSQKGLVSFRPEEVGANNYVPPVRITALKQAQYPMALGRAPERADSISLDWKHNFFEFEYTALNYTNSANNRYKYMLKGLDRDWYDAGTRRFGRYSGLRGGDYTLRIIASNNDGVWNRDGVSLRVHVASPWWEAGWFYASAGTLAAIAILLFSRNRNRRLRMERAAVEAIRQSEERYRLLNADLERRVQERTAELAAANRELEAFSSSVSHDLRAPLSAIDGFAGIIKEDFTSVLPSEAIRYVDFIRDGVSRMRELIEGLLALSRVSRQPLRKKRIHTAELVQEALQALSGERKGRNVEVSIGAFPPCDGDAVLLRQVWVNLFSNALKFTRPRDPTRIEAGCENREGEDVFFVKDNGVGMDMDYGNKLFKAFQRLHTDKEFEGTGLGLALVHQIVQKHGGRVWAESRVGEGAALYFTLEKRPSSASGSP